MSSKRAPMHLKPATRRWYRHVISEYQLEPHHVELLRLCCEALDRAEDARAMLAEEGTIVQGRFGPKAHPAIAIERDSRHAFARLLRELDLDVDPPAEAARPPLL